MIVESLLDGKRFPAYSNAKIIALEDISIYTEDEDMPLKTVFKRMYEKEEGKPAINHKESSAVITNYIESVSFILCYTVLYNFLGLRFATVGAKRTSTGCPAPLYLPLSEFVNTGGTI